MIIMISILIMESRALSLLRALVAVGESSNFRQAAERLNLSQPAISQKLKELESQDVGSSP